MQVGEGPDLYFADFRECSLKAAFKGQLALGKEDARQLSLLRPHPDSQTQHGGDAAMEVKAVWESGVLGDLVFCGSIEAILLAGKNF